MRTMMAKLLVPLALSAMAFPGMAEAEQPRDRLLGCNEFKAEFARAIREFGDILPAPEFKDKTIGGPLMPPLQEIANYWPLEINAVIECDENGLVGLEAGLYERSNHALARWNNFANAVIKALDPASGRDRVLAVRTRIDADIQEAMKRNRPCTDTDILSKIGDMGAIEDVPVGDYIVDYTAKTKTDNPAKINVVPRYPEPYRYKRIEKSGTLLSCERMKSALSGSSVPTAGSVSVTTAPAVGVTLERHARAGGIETRLLCDRGGRMLRFETETDRRTAEWDDWLDDVLSAYGKASGVDTSGTLSSMREKAEEDLKQAKEDASADPAPSNPACPAGDIAGSGDEEIGDYAAVLTFEEGGIEESLTMEP